MRAEAFERLAADDKDDDTPEEYGSHLDYILSVEILNEGVDIPGAFRCYNMMYIESNG